MCVRSVLAGLALLPFRYVDRDVLVDVDTQIASATDTPTVDEHKPYFKDEHVKIYLSNEHLANVDKAIYRVEAVDEDSHQCRTSRPCECGHVKYTLLDQSGMFTLNTTTGQLFVTPSDDTVSMMDKSFDVQVVAHTASRQSDYRSDPLKLTITAQQEINRIKRDTNKRKVNKPTDSKPVGNADNAPTVTFSLRTVAGEVNSLQVGNSIHYRLEIALPRGTVDLILQIYTKDSYADSKVNVDKSIPAISIYNFSIPQRIPSISYNIPEPKFELSNKSRNVVRLKRD